MASDWLQVTKRRKLLHEFDQSYEHKSNLEKLPKEIFALIISNLKTNPHLRILRLCSKYFYREFENLFIIAYRVPPKHTESNAQVTNYAEFIL